MWHTSAQLPGIQALMTNWLFQHSFVCVGCEVAVKTWYIAPKKYLPWAYGSDVHILLSSSRYINQNGVMMSFSTASAISFEHIAQHIIIISGIWVSVSALQRMYSSLCPDTASISSLFESYRKLMFSLLIKGVDELLHAPFPSLQAAEETRSCRCGR